jgi:hypothetical protein
MRLLNGEGGGGAGQALLCQSQTRMLESAQWLLRARCRRIALPRRL